MSTPTHEHNEQATPEYTLAPIEANGHGSASSVFDALRAKRAEYAVEQTYDLDVTGYGGQLVLRCGAIPSRVYAVLRERYERSRSPERDFDLNADVLVAACREVMWRDPETSELRSIEDEPVTLDERLAAGLGLEAASGRELVRQLFGAAPSPELAIGTEVNAYMEWASSVNTDIDGVFTGESQPAPR